MLQIFQKGTNKELELILTRMKMNAENNYRDATISDLKQLEELFAALNDGGKLNEKQKSRYSGLIDRYKTEFRGFTHKEQKTGW